MTLLERLEASAANYWGGFALDLALSLLAIALGGAHLAAIAAGIVEYTLLEYAFHRWVYHARWNPIAHLHRIHHDHPQRMLGAPLFFAPCVAVVHAALAALVVPVAVAVVFAGAVLGSYAIQSAIHHIVHGWTGTHVLRGRLIHAWRRHHMRHHRRGDANFGIVTGVWDRVFRTKR